MPPTRGLRHTLRHSKRLPSTPRTIASPAERAVTDAQQHPGVLASGSCSSGQGVNLAAAQKGATTHGSPRQTRNGSSKRSRRDPEPIRRAACSPEADIVTPPTARSLAGTQPSNRSAPRRGSPFAALLPPLECGGYIEPSPLPGIESCDAITSIQRLAGGGEHVARARDLTRAPRLGLLLRERRRPTPTPSTANIPVDTRSQSALSERARA